MRDSYLATDNLYIAASDVRSSRPRNNDDSSLDDTAHDSSDTAEFMNSLFYEGFDYRKESLEGPRPQTFEWIFSMSGESTLPEIDVYKRRPEEERHTSWPSFPRWLESLDSSSQYCLLGKAGSGKSTLMA